MDISAGSCPKSHWRNGTRDEHKHLDQIFEKKICSYFLKEHLIFFYSSFKNALLFQFRVLK